MDANTTVTPVTMPTIAPAQFIRGWADVAKLVMSAVMFFVVLAATLLPGVFVRRFRSSETPTPSRRRHLLRQGISCLNCFAGGVFLATGILDVLPDAIEGIENGFQALKMTVSFPVAHFSLLIGFFILLCVEQIIACCHGHHHSHGPPTHSTPLLPDPTGRALESRNWRTMSLTASLEGQRDVSPSEFTHAVRQARTRPKPQRRFYGENAVVPSPSSSARQMSDVNHFNPSLDDSMADEEIPDHFVEIVTSGGSPIRSIFLIGAMSVHSLFEGLALGLEEQSSSVYQLLAAIALHKFILAVAIGLSLGQTRQLSLSLLAGGSIVFAIASPCGTLIGMALRYVASREGSIALARFKLASGILQGMACGTFLYVTFFEILPREINEATRPRQRTFYMLFLLLGFSLMSTLIYFA